MNKKTRNFFTILGMAVAIGGAAFTAPKEKVATNALDVWYFQGTSLSEAEDAANYSKTPNPNCNIGATLPCELEPINAPDYSELEIFLEGKSGADIRDFHSVSKRM